MAAIEKLLTMGLAHGIDPTRMLLAAGGSTAPESERLTWQDVTQAVTTLTHEQRAALYLKTAPELASARELAAFTNTLYASLIEFEQPDLTDKATLQRQPVIVRVAIAEYMAPRTCRRCRGNGQVLDHIVGRGMVPGTCGLCEGKGWRAWSDNTRSRECGVRRADWSKRYAPGYTHVLHTCSGLYRKAAEGFKQALFGTAETPVETRLQARC